jgi:arylsulfatase A-like enzyme
MSEVRTLFLSVVALLCAACGGGDPEQPSEGQAPVRIVLVSLDTTRGDHFTPERMPLTWARAQAGRVFSRHYSVTSTTQPTHATVFTGLLPWEHGVGRNGLLLDGDRETLAEQLGQAGFEARAVVASYPLHPFFGFDQGFDDYYADFQLAKSNDTWSGEKMKVPNFYSLGDHITDRAIEALDAMQGPRQFLFVHYFDAHGPYGDTGSDKMALATVMGAIRRGDQDMQPLLQRLNDLYSVDVASMDEQLERLMLRLDQDDVPTHVVVFADHGESLGEDGSFGHGKHLGEAQIHVPAFVLSSRVKPGVVDIPVGSLDVHATVLALAGVEQRGTLGRDLTAPDLKDVPVMGMRRTFVQPYRDLRLDGRARMIDGYRFYLVDGPDVFEGDGTKVVGSHGTARKVPAERASRMLTLFQRFTAELEAGGASEVAGDDVQRALEAMGYAR